MTPKDVKKLVEKKHRVEAGLFIVEGEKSIIELLRSNFIVEAIFGTVEFLDQIDELVMEYQKRNPLQRAIALVETRESELSRMGTFETNNAGIAVAAQKETINSSELLARAQDGLVLALSNVRDPGNLGTIIRIADWFGVAHIIASVTTTDFYNPKTIAASMGSFTRMNVTYLDLEQFLHDAHATKVAIIGAVLDGKNIHEGNLPTKGILVMGSESHGISEEILPFISEKVTIPKYGQAESLNVSIATGILLDALRRGGAN